MVLCLVCSYFTATSRKRKALTGTEPLSSPDTWSFNISFLSIFVVLIYINEYVSQYVLELIPCSYSSVTDMSSVEVTDTFCENQLTIWMYNKTLEISFAKLCFTNSNIRSVLMWAYARSHACTVPLLQSSAGEITNTWNSLTRPTNFSFVVRKINC